MRNLLNFLIKYNSWFVFAFYVLLSCVLLFRDNVYQQSVYLTSANGVCTAVNGVVSGVRGYFGLLDTNAELARRNAELEKEVLNLSSELGYVRTLVPDDSIPASAATARFDYVMASVVGNSTMKPLNYFTINKGAADGIARGMGVVDHNGVVGIVNVVGRNTSRVISLLNESQHFSVCVKGTKSVGLLGWKHGNTSTAYAEEMPRHKQYRTGDTIVTSGFSTIFPAGIPVGRVVSRVRAKDDNFITLKVHLFPDFSQLGTVRVIKDIYQPEIDSLQSHDALPEM